VVTLRTTNVAVQRLARRKIYFLIPLAVVVFMAAAANSGQSFADIIANLSTRFLGVFIEAVPFLLLGALASGLIDAFVGPDDIARWVPRNPLLAALMGTFMGVAFPVCECGVVPVVRRLYSKGLPTSVGVTFLLAAPVMNPIVLVSTYIALSGTPGIAIGGLIIPYILIARYLFTIIVATTVGLIFSFAARPQDVLRPDTLLPIRGGSGGVMPLVVQQPRPPLLAGLHDALHLAGEDFFDMSRYLILGSLLSAALQTFVREDALLALGQGPVVSVLVMLALAFILCVCSTVDAFVALAFVGTFTTGSIIAFLTFGPMVDLKSTLMFLGVYRRKTVLYLIVLPLLLAAFIGIWLNLNVAF